MAYLLLTYDIDFICLQYLVLPQKPVLSKDFAAEADNKSKNNLLIRR